MSLCRKPWPADSIPSASGRDDPKWMEAFLHPKNAMGVLVQLAQVAAPLVSTAPDEFPLERRQRHGGSDPLPPASFVEVVHAVANLQSAVDLFVGLLGASVASRGRDLDHCWMSLTWGDPLRLRLVAPLDSQSSGPVQDWLRGKNGRVHHLVFEVEEPESVPGARPGTYERFGVERGSSAIRCTIDPSENAGLGLVLLSKQ